VIRAVALILLLSACSLAADLDAAIARVMKGRSGTAIVLTVESGQILGSYHLEVAARRLARPGSAFKPFTLMALLETHKLNPNEPFTCRRNLHVGRHNLSCSHPQTGPLQAVSALAYSCNDYFATMGARLSAEELRAAFAELGFSRPTSLVANEAIGSIQLARSDEERQLQAIGEGEMRVTPLEMVVAYRNLAARRLLVSDRGDQPIFAGLEAATEYGMARLAAVKGVKVAGKTGTARSDQGTWTNAWFAGYAPADKPQIAVVVFLEKGTGPGDAAPLASEIIQAWHEWQEHR
jgi:cell division protein FtsI/penicillin-binding protein 2